LPDYLTGMAGICNPGFGVWALSATVWRGFADVRSRRVQRATVRVSALPRWRSSAQMDLCAGARDCPRRRAPGALRDFEGRAGSNPRALPSGPSQSGRIPNSPDSAVAFFPHRATARPGPSGPGHAPLV